MKVSHPDAMRRLIQVLTRTSPLRPGTIIWLDHPDEVQAWDRLVDLIVPLQGAPYALLVARDYSEVSILPLPGLPITEAWEKIAGTLVGEPPPPAAPTGDLP